jgi:hypothetical protein
MKHTKTIQNMPRELFEIHHDIPFCSLYLQQQLLHLPPLIKTLRIETVLENAALDGRIILT